MATKRKQRRPDILSVSMPLDSRAALTELAASAGLPVSAVVTAAVDLGHVRGAVEELRRLASLPEGMVPAGLRATVAKMQAAA